jgi:hypothetical protein
LQIITAEPPVIEKPTQSDDPVLGTSHASRIARGK